MQVASTDSARHVRLTLSLALAGGFLFPAVATTQSSRPSAQQDSSADHLRGNTLLIVRHAEKPETGTGLTPKGERRAQAYANYFEPFHEGKEEFRVDALYAGADSTNSNRPRLSLEPLSREAHLAIDDTIGTKDPASLVALLRLSQHGTHPLVCWRHGQIPALLQAFGADPALLLPAGKWPDEVFDWILVLHFDTDGKLTSSERLVEHLIVP